MSLPPSIALPEPPAKSASRRLRVLHMTAASDAGGLSRYILDLCSAMHARGHDVTVAGRRGAWHSLFEAAPWPWVDAPLNGGPPELWRAARLLRRHLAAHPVDVIHTHYRRPTLVARWLQKRFDVPILYTVHQPRIEISGAWRMLSDFGDHTHVASEDARRWLVEQGKVDPDRVTVIPHGVDPARFPRRDPAQRAAARAALGLPADAPVAAFVGRLDVPKNADWMLDVAAASRHAMPALKIVIAGDGPDAAALRRRAARDNLRERVLFLGETDPLPVYQAADALLAPSQREGFLLVCAEAMSVGVPVLRTRTGGALEMIVEGVTGRSVPVDRRAFAAAAVEFLSDASALESMGAAAADHVRSRCSFGRQVERTVEMYREMVAHRQVLRHRPPALTLRRAAAAARHFWRAPPTTYNGLPIDDEPGVHAAVEALLRRAGAKPGARTQGGAGARNGVGTNGGVEAKNVAAVNCDAVLDLSPGAGAMLARLRDAGFKDLCAAHPTCAAHSMSAAEAPSGRPAAPGVALFPMDFSAAFSADAAGRFAVVLALGMIHRVDDPRAFLVQARELLAADGLLVLSAPNLANWTGRVRFLLTGRLRGFDDAHYRRLHHLWPLFDGPLRSLLEDVGLRVVAADSAGNRSGPLKKLATAPLSLPLRMAYGPAAVADVNLYVATRADAKAATSAVPRTIADGAGTTMGPK